MVVKGIQSSVYKKLFQIVFVITFLFLTIPTVKAQLTDTAKTTVIDTTKKANFTGANKVIITSKHSPRKATILSAAFPGLGQIYNKKYWKLPIIYGGFVALAYSINYNQTKYKTYLNAYKDRIDNDPNTVDPYVGYYTDDNLNTLQHYYHRYRDLSVIGTLALYLLNVVDASVDAHLFSFDVSEDISLNVHPTLINTAYINHYLSGVSLTIKL